MSAATDQPTSRRFILNQAAAEEMGEKKEKKKQLT